MIRAPAVAGSFYPADPGLLIINIDHYLAQAQNLGKPPKAIIVPHAGYIYSGAIAASAYTRLKSAARQIRKIVLIGPSHHVSFSGLALSSAQAYRTPLGDIKLDTIAKQTLLNYPFVNINDLAHAHDHSLEVQLPFLQSVLDEFTLQPIITGKASAEQVATVLSHFWGEPDTLLVVSSDLSHFLTYKQAQAKDNDTNDLILNLDYQAIGSDAACGCVAISGLLKLLETMNLPIKNIDLRNSGDTAGDKQRVVGYGAYVVD